MSANTPPSADICFDAFAEDYDAALEKGIAVSGESKEYFVHGRLSWVARRLRQLEVRPRSALDFGCGAGSAIPALPQILGVESVLGVDVSEQSLAVARKLRGSEGVELATPGSRAPRGDIDLAYCNGVFHHIPPSERDEAVRYVFESLRPGGLFAFWENNPWNPGTRYVMSRIPFDRDAITLSVLEARALLVRGGFEIVTADFLFLFPRALGLLRPLERCVTRLPLGAQYMVLGRKPLLKQPPALV